MRDDLHYLRLTIDLAAESRASGNHPFGALLVEPGGGVIFTAGNTFRRDRGPGHAEANVARDAARSHSPEFLSRCTLFTSVEPCCMCAGCAYWAGIGAVVFGMTEARLAELTADNPENLTLDLDCRRVFAAGRRKVEVRGPYPELEDEIVRGHAGFW